MVDSWERQKAENDLRQMALNGLFRETSKGCNLDVHPPGINAMTVRWRPVVLIEMIFSPLLSTDMLLAMSKYMGVSSMFPMSSLG